MTSTRRRTLPRESGIGWHSVNAIWFQVAAPQTWTSAAACSRVPNSGGLFTEATDFHEADAGLMICAGCPVRHPCLAYGQRLHADGVWGGELLHRGKVRHRPFG
jgi:hypothetical protein